MDPVIRCTTLPSHSRFLKGFFFHFSWRSIHFYRLSHSELDDIEKDTNTNYACSSHTVISSKILRVLRIILVVFPEHPSDTKVLTMKMEILLEPTSNKLLWVFNSLVHSLCALSTLRRSGLRTASAAAKPCQGDSSEFYLITGRIPNDLQHSFRNSDVCYHDPEKCVHAGPMVTTLHGANNTTRMIKRFTVADDLKESSKIIQLLAKIKSQNFDTLNDNDVVGLCLLAILKLVLLGQEPRHNVPDWCLRLVTDKTVWDMYPWGSYVWPTLYNQLRNANVKGWQAFYATPEEPDSDLPKYTLMGFTWAFKGARPSPRLTPDAFEAKLEWCVLSRALFDGHIREPPRIPPPVNQHSRDDVPEDIYRHMAEQDRLLKEAQSKVASHDGFPQGGPKIFTTQTNNSFFDGAQMTLTYPTSQDQPMSSSYPSSYPATSHIMTPMELQGFVPWSSIYQATVDPKHGPSHNCDVGGVILSPYMRLPDTTVAPKKQAGNSRNTTRNAQVSAFNLGKADGDENARVEEVMITEACATENYISFGKVDPNKIIIRELLIRSRPPGARYTVAKLGTASLHPGSKIFVIEMNQHIRGTLDGLTLPYPSWDDVDLRGSIMYDDMTYSSLVEMLKKKLKLEANDQLNLSVKLPSFDSRMDITNDEEHYNKDSEVKVGNTFDNKEALDLAVRLKALEDGYQFLSKKSYSDRKLPITMLTKTYRAMVQEWYFKRREVAANMKYEITYWVADK
ncbi:phospholipase-like protein, partial [Tanacetum coccineum]